MGNLCNRGSKEDPDSAWQAQNKEMERNPIYKFADLNKKGKLIEAYRKGGVVAVQEIARREIKPYLYNEGKGQLITKLDYIKWKRNVEAQRTGSTVWESKSDEELIAEFNEQEKNSFNKFEPHEACWDMDKRGGVGETPFQMLYLMDSAEHVETAKILLNLYPKLALDIYEADEYFGESCLHLATVYGDFESVKLLVSNGAYVNQRATGRFFLPEDQKNGKTNQTNYEGFVYYGEYPLAFAVCFAYMDIYDYLIDNGADPNLQDSFGNTALHMAVIADQPEMYKYMVKHHKKPAKKDIRNHASLTPLTLASKLGRHRLFKEILELNSIDFWRYSNVTCSAYPLTEIDSITANGEPNWNSALMIVINGDEDEHLNMLEGGVMRQLLDDKWKTFARRRFIERLILTFIHLSLISVAVYLRPAADLTAYTKAADGVRFTAEIIVLFFCIGYLALEVIEIGSQGPRAFLKNCSHAPDHTVFMISCLLILICIPFRFLELRMVEDILLILAVPGSWAFLLFFARCYEYTGPFVVLMYKMICNDLLKFAILMCIFMGSFSLESALRQVETADQPMMLFLCCCCKDAIDVHGRMDAALPYHFPLSKDGDVASEENQRKAAEPRSVKLTGPFVTMIYKMCVGDLFRFGIIYLIFLMGFTQGFYFLFRDINQESFNTFPATIMTLFQMTLGEFKYHDFDLTRYATLTKIVFAVFMILVPILLLNMLIAMMGNTYQSVISKSEKEWRKQWAKIVVVLERGFTRKQLQRFHREYSIKLAGPSSEDDTIREEIRALVVIKTSRKTKARQRKIAVGNWKKLGREIIIQLKSQKKTGKTGPFRLQKITRKSSQLGAKLEHGVSEDEEDRRQFSSITEQLAWGKDIDLTVGQAFTTDPGVIENSGPKPVGKPSGVTNVSIGNNTGGDSASPDRKTSSDDHTQMPNGNAARVIKKYVKKPNGTPKSSPKSRQFSINRVSPLTLYRQESITEDIELDTNDMQLDQPDSPSASKEHETSFQKRPGGLDTVSKQNSIMDEGGIDNDAYVSSHIPEDTSHDVKRRVGAESVFRVDSADSNQMNQWISELIETSPGSSPSKSESSPSHALRHHKSKKRKDKKMKKDKKRDRSKSGERKEAAGGSGTPSSDKLLLENEHLELIDESNL